MAEKNMNNEKATPSTSLEQPIIYLLDTNTLLIVKRSSSQRVSPKSLLLNSEKKW